MWLRDGRFWGGIEKGGGDRQSHLKNFEKRKAPGASGTGSDNNVGFAGKEKSRMEKETTISKLLWDPKKGTGRFWDGGLKLGGIIFWKKGVKKCGKKKKKKNMHFNWSFCLSLGKKKTWYPRGKAKEFGGEGEGRPEGRWGGSLYSPRATSHLGERGGARSSWDAKKGKKKGVQSYVLEKSVRKFPGGPTSPRGGRRNDISQIEVLVRQGFGRPEKGTRRSSPQKGNLLRRTDDQ